MVGCSIEIDSQCQFFISVKQNQQVPGFGRAAMCADMDAWGYTFRLGSAARWFEEDATDAREWLAARGLLALA